MIFKRGDYVICKIKKFNIKASNSDYYDVTLKRGIISGIILETDSGIMHLVKLENDDPWGRPFDQMYIYEENIDLDIAKIRENKLKDIGI
jgi:uncharacterized protein (UPF0254 family)